MASCNFSALASSSAWAASFFSLFCSSSLSSFFLQAFSFRFCLNVMNVINSNAIEILSRQASRLTANAGEGSLKNLRRTLARRTISIFSISGLCIKNDFSTPTPEAIFRTVIRDVCDFLLSVRITTPFEHLNTLFVAFLNFLVNTNCVTNCEHSTTACFFLRLVDFVD